MTHGVETIYMETHNWGKTVKFWQKLGYELVLDLGHSGKLKHPRGGPGLFIEEVPEGRELSIQLYLGAPDMQAKPESPVKVTADWHDSHWGTKLLELEDPDGRRVVAQFPPEDARKK